MFQKIMKKYNELDIYDLYTLIIILCFLLFFISLVIGKNIYLFILMYILVIYLSRSFSNKIIIFLVSTLPLLLVGAIIIPFFSLKYFTIDIINILYIIIKLWLGISYIILIYLLLKSKRKKTIRNTLKRFKYYSFKELRKRHYKYYQERNKDVVKKYIEKNKIDNSSDYYKVIEDNIDNKSKQDLEEFVWINYLRFYKNKRFLKNDIFSLINVAYLIIHIIMVLLIFVR